MKHFLLAVAVAALPAAALADIVGTYQAGAAKERQTMTISYKDDNSIRMDVGNNSWMLVTGSKAYMVTQDDGETTVIDIDSLPKFAMPKGKPVAKADGKEPKVVINKTGRTETIAGIKGDVYDIRVDNERHEVVLSTDKKAQVLNKAFMALSKRMAQSLGADMSAQLELASREAQKHGYGGLLRSNQDFVLQSLKETALPASHYALPKGAAPMQMPAMPQFDPAMMQQMQKQMQQMMKDQGR